MKIRTILIIIVIVVGWYLISPAFNDIEADDTSPLEFNQDALDHMDSEEKEEFMQEMQKMKDTEIIASESMPPSSLLATGMLQAKAHDVEGDVLLIEADGKKILRFEDFETINGPNLHIYLATDTSSDDFIDLGKIKATKGNVNYELDQDIDTDKYNHVLVWCVPFKVLFSYAELS